MNVEPMRIRKMQRIFSAVFLIIIISVLVATLGTQMEFKVQAPAPETSTATRLMIFHEGYNIELERPTELIIRAVTSDGEIDPTRDDLVELNITSLSYLMTQAELSVTTIKLQNGTGSVLLTGHSTEMVRFTANWKDGKSELKPAMMVLNVGVGGE